MSRLKEECGVFGIFNNKDSAALTALGLHALQHRGQEGCGIVTSDGKKFYAERRLGLVGDNFTKGKILEKLLGSSAIGHNRYSTAGNNLIKNVQPFFADLHTGGIGIAHNGNLSNALHLRMELVKEGSIFQTTSDTETIVQLIAKSIISFGIFFFATLTRPLNSTVLFTSCTTSPLLLSSIKSIPRIPPPTALDVFAHKSSSSLLISQISGSAPKAMFVLNPPEDFLYIAAIA